MSLSSVERSIPGEYQLNALLRGRAFQRAWHRARLDLVAGVLPPAADTPGLDAAAGSGILTYRFPVAHLVSADMRLSACRAVRSHSPAAACVTAELGALPFKSGSFAQLYLLEALEHLTANDGRGALLELGRVARPGARLLLTTPNYGSHWVVLERILDTIGATPAMAKGQHQCRYRRRSLVRLLQETGWRVLRLGTFNLVAPLVGMLSARAGATVVNTEAAMLKAGGALLYAVCERRREP